MEEITPAQKKQLEAWATRRDEILGEISRLDTEKEEKIKRNAELNASNTDVETRINQGLGRLQEIDRQEAERAKYVSREVAALESQKTELQSEVNGLKQVIVGLISKRDDLTLNVETLTLVHGKVFDRTAALETLVDHVSRVTGESVTIIEKCLALVKDSADEIVAVNKKNVAESMIIIEKLPRAMMEYRRPIIPGRTVVSKRSPIINSEEGQ